MCRYFSYVFLARVERKWTSGAHGGGWPLLFLPYPPLGSSTTGKRSNVNIPLLVWLSWWVEMKKIGWNKYVGAQVKRVHI